MVSGNCHLFPLSLKSLSVDGTFSGYASVYNVVDNQRDVMLRGAFNDSLKSGGKEVKLLWQHRMDEPIGVFTLLHEDARGLYVEGRLLLDVARAREAYALLKSGALDGLSIGYRPVDFEFDAKTGLRLIRAVELFEISLVTFPANAEAKVRAVKALAPDSPEAALHACDRALRALGAPRRTRRYVHNTKQRTSPLRLSSEEQRLWNQQLRTGEVMRLAAALEGAQGACGNIKRKKIQARRRFPGVSA